jgi:hypothetical protein
MRSLGFRGDNLPETPDEKIMGSCAIMQNLKHYKKLHTELEVWRSCDIFERVKVSLLSS